MNRTDLAPLHVIAGAGQIGPMVARRLLARGLRVRMLRRGPVVDPPAGVEVVRADASDPAAAIEAMRGASVVYHCANPRYHRWPAELAPLARGILAGAAAAGARLVVLDNLYMYGAPAGGRMAEDTPVAPCSRKGTLRAQVAAELLAAGARGEVPVAIARAADFFGPGCANSLLGDRMWKRLLADRPVEVLGDPDQLHSYSYTGDVAGGLVTLGLAGDDAAVRGVWHLPAPPAESTRAWIERFAGAVGTRPRMARLSPLLLRAAGLFIPEARELPEMIYQWNAPFVLDDRRFRAAFGVGHTPVEEAVAATVAWVRGTEAGMKAAA